MPSPSTSEGAVTILWNEGTVGEWAALFARVPRSTLPQCFAYAGAMGRTHGFVPRLGLIRRDGTPIGIVQLLERRTLRLFHQRQIHRGPLWLDGIEPDLEIQEAVFRLLRRTCPDNPLNRASLLPELAAGPEAEAMLQRCGFRRFGPGYRTVWLDLSRGEEELRAAMARDWRQRLKGAEKAGLVIDLDWEAKNLPWLMKQEHEQALTKQFRPMTGALAVRIRNALLKGGGKGDGVLMVAALEDRSKTAAPAASALFYIHGGSATYQIGWSSESGRKSGAMRLVLWRAALALKARGVGWLDLGGINPDSAPGVTEFKLGTGGQAAESAGLFR
ncbi:GNAT family N-acetyltransferase [Azospirillum brasilense]|uniref:GNAT family N-acetyltransferase n=1 Tax=Azospirillum argentinense TaxID=2970906 RepID=A0A2K1FQW7_9PROT|nr:GNAT family N-acetyltransferase [Azospirillum argentinense]MBK3801186.1 GNAT family N-acetyltransferase [Azospirillum argentinense]PNQ94936.1 GNAT family N-acetyltransferase [Azospirillum argentinense]